jgi:hypothetical protein
MSMPNDLVLLPVMWDSVNTSAEAVSSRNLLFINGLSHLEVLVVKEEVWRLLAILPGHEVVWVEALAIARDGNDLGAWNPFLVLFLKLNAPEDQEVEGALNNRWRQRNEACEAVGVIGDGKELHPCFFIIVRVFQYQGLIRIDYALSRDIDDGSGILLFWDDSHRAW